MPPVWDWFELKGPVSPPSSAALASDASRGIYRVDVDGHPIPFKMLFRPGKPSRPVLMLLHGMGLTIASFREVLPYLFDSHDLILPDYSGFSAPGPRPPASLKAFAGAVWRIADVLGIDRLSLVGNSLGGGLALMATLVAPRRVERLLLSNPACYPQNLPGIYRLTRVPLLGELFMSLTAPEKFIDGVAHIGYVDQARFDPILRAQYTRNLIPARNRFRLMELIRQLPGRPSDFSNTPHVPHLGSIRQPTLISWGEQDPLLVEGAGKRLAADLPDAAYDPHPDLAHMPHEEAPDRIGRRWAEFLK